MLIIALNTLGCVGLELLKCYVSMCCKYGEINESGEVEDIPGVEERRDLMKQVFIGRSKEDIGLREEVERDG